MNCVARTGFNLVCTVFEVFRSETENDSKINFLDITVEKKDGTFETSVYRKPTFSGLYMNFESFLPLEYKIGLVRTLLHRGFELCSRMNSFHKELEFLKAILLKNGYGKSFLDSCVNRFLNTKFGPGAKKTTIPKKEFFLVLPYTGHLGIQVKKQIEALIQRCLPHAQVRTVFRPILRVSMLFSYKDRTPKSLRSSVVYKFTCAQCSVRNLKPNNTITQ